MGFLNFVMALSPIIVVLVGILGFRQSARRVAPVALIWTLVLAFTYFNVTGATFKENVAVYDALLWKGIKEGLKIVLMVFGAFVILNLLRATGAIDEVKGTIARISDDRRVQVVIIGMMLHRCQVDARFQLRQGLPNFLQLPVYFAHLLCQLVHCLRQIALDHNGLDRLR